LRVCAFGDSVHMIMNAWVSDLDEDPIVSVQFAPAFSILGTALCPPKAVAFDILCEASSVVCHYAPMLREDFAGSPNPPIPGPLPGPLRSTNVHHAKIALHALLVRIQTMKEPRYPTLSNLPSGSYVCDVSITWANTVQAVTLCKV
jgi:hypothetical protein